MSHLSWIYELSFFSFWYDFDSWREYSYLGKYGNLITIFSFEIGSTWNAYLHSCTTVISYFKELSLLHCHRFCVTFNFKVLMFLFELSKYFIYSVNFIKHVHPLPFAEVTLISSSSVSSVGDTSLGWCRAENQTRTCLTASRRTTN